MGRQTPRRRKEAPASRREEARGAAPGQSRGDARAPAAELRALPRRPRGPARPSTRRPASSRLRTASLGRGPPTERGKTRASRGDRLGAAGGSVATPRRARGPGVSEPPGAPGARRRRLRTVPAALRPRPKPLEAGRSRAGPGGTYRARRRGARRARRFLRGCLRAAAGGRGAPGELGQAAGRAGGGPARLGWAALAPSAAPGGRAVRGSGEPSGSDVRGVSAPNRERGRAPRREGREKERAGGRRGRAPPGAQEGAPRPPAPRPPLPPPPSSPGPGPDAVRRRGGATGGRPRGGAESPAPPIRSFKAHSAGFLRARTAPRLPFPEPGATGPRRASG